MDTWVKFEAMQRLCWALSENDYFQAIVFTWEFPCHFFFFESPPSELKSNSNMIPDGYRSMRSNPRMKSLLSNFPSFRVIL